MRTLIVVLALLVAACTNVDQTTFPSSVDVNVAQPNTGVSTGSGGGGTDTTPGEPVSIVLDPSSVEGIAPGTVVVQVIALDQAGDEVPSANITVSGLDTSVARFTTRDGRWVSFALVGPGTTTAIITASGAQATLVFTVN